LKAEADDYKIAIPLQTLLNFRPNLWPLARRDQKPLQNGNLLLKGKNLLLKGCNLPLQFLNVTKDDGAIIFE